MLKNVLIFLCVLIMTYCIKQMFPNAKTKKQKMIDYVELFGIVFILFVCCFYRHYEAIKFITSLILSLIVMALIEYKRIVKLIK